MVKEKSLRDRIKSLNENQKQLFLKFKNPQLIFVKRTDFFNELIFRLFRKLPNFDLIEKKVFLCAVGGFGRNELYPKSDIDVFIVYKNIREKELTPIIQEVFLPIIDCGIEVSYIFKEWNELPNLETELTTITSLLNIRYIAGNYFLYENWLNNFRSFLFKNRKTYKNLKIEEYQLRYKKYNQSPYILEPNIKEGIGGLREFHYIKWLAQVIIGIRDLEYLYNAGLIEKYEHKMLKEAYKFLSTIRCYIHFFETGRKEILTFQLQEHIAQFLGYQGEDVYEKIEKFMGDYYRYTHEVFMISKKLFHNYELLLKRPKNFIRKEIDRGISIEGFGEGEICVYEREVEENPRILLKAFYYSRRLKKSISFKTMNLIKKLSNKLSIYIWDDEMKNLFMDILSPGSTEDFNTIMQMYESDFLKIIIPEFSDIYHKMQFDAYHIYTIDVHSLMTAKKIWDFFEVNYFEIREKIKNPWLLVLSALLHDIGKGVGKSHAEVGAKIVEQISVKMGLSNEDAELLKFLVRKHLLMSWIARHRDISDIIFLKKVFTEEIRNVEYLNYLFFLTVADAMSVGEGAWSSWKENLYTTLYNNFVSTSKSISVALKDFIEDSVLYKVEILKGQLKKAGKEYLTNLISVLPKNYILTNDIKTIIRDLEIDYKFLNSNEDFILEILNRPNERVSEIIIATKDSQGLFSQLAGAFTYVGFNILSATINTRNNGNILDIFLVDMGRHDIEIDTHLFDKLRDVLSKIIKEGEKIDELVINKAKKYHKKSVFKEKNEVVFDNKSSDEYTIIDVFANDHMGLLFEITRTLNMLSLNIYFSKISTYGERAVDVFYVKKDGKKLDNAEMDYVRNQILRAISH
ncbi:MAG: [protein-PII] uridylyltransferase [Proteobacteria bacterium]|nr:[protein-PII] uridylyltransferase [Pseudomonadota bacterium]